MTGTPATPEATQKLLERVTYIRHTIFGGFWDFTANMEHKDTAYTTLAIGPHTDGTYSFDAPGYQMLHCLAFNGTGGENVFVDGFKVADIMKREHAEDYRALTGIEITGQYIDNDRNVHLQASRPLFRLNRMGQLVQVSYNNYDRAPFYLPAEEIGRAVSRAEDLRVLRQRSEDAVSPPAGAGRCGDVRQLARAACPRCLSRLSQAVRRLSQQGRRGEPPAPVA